MKFSTKKIYRQKGTGGARHGSKKAPIFRKRWHLQGPDARGPTPTICPRSSARLASSTRSRRRPGQGRLIVIEDAALGEAKTNALAKALNGLGVRKALVIDGAEVNENFARAAQNLDNVDVLPSQGANVYDILKRETLVLTKAGVEALQERLK